MFVPREPERALLAVTAQTSDFQGKLLAMVAPIVHKEIDAGRIDPPLRDLAHLTSWITETFVYADTTAEETPHPAKVRQPMRALRALPRLSTSGGHDGEARDP